MPREPKNKLKACMMPNGRVLQTMVPNKRTTPIPPLTRNQRDSIRKIMTELSVTEQTRVIGALNRFVDDGQFFKMSEELEFTVTDDGRGNIYINFDCLRKDPPCRWMKTINIGSA